MPPIRRIVVVTGTRAEFGLLLPVIRAIRADRRLALSLVVTGAHLTAGTWRDIAAAGIPIAARVPMQRRGVTGRAADVASLSRGIAGVGRALDRIKPDVTLVLGDRIEAFAAACAAGVGGLRLAHVHGGDRAEGVADEAMRHAISKLSHLHFAATAQSRDRLLRLGEPRDRVFNVGSPAMDGLRGVPAAHDAPDVIVMQHPVGGSDADEARWFRATMQAVLHSPGFSRGSRTANRHETNSQPTPRLKPGLYRSAIAHAPPRVLVMAPNADPGSAGIRAAMRAMRLDVIEHLPRERFLAMLKGCRVLVGNSSAGLIEAAALRVPVVNVGPRQGGRERPGNVIDCDYGLAPVRDAIRRALRLDRSRIRHPYGNGHAGERIARTLATIDLQRVTIRKRNSY